MEILAADQVNYAARNHTLLLYESDSEKVVMYERGNKLTIHFEKGQLR